MEYYSVMRKEKVMQFVALRNLDSIILNEVRGNLTQNDLSHMQNIEKYNYVIVNVHTMEIKNMRACL